MHPWEGAVKEERFLNIRKSPHWWGDKSEQRGSFRASEETATTGFQKAKGRETYIDGQYHHPMLLSLRCLLCWCGRGLGAEAQASEVRPREKTGLGCTETA